MSDIPQSPSFWKRTQCVVSAGGMVTVAFVAVVALILGGTLFWQWFKNTTFNAWPTYAIFGALVAFALVRKPVQNWFEERAEERKNNPSVEGTSNALSLTKEDMKPLFTALAIILAGGLQWFLFANTLILVNPEGFAKNIAEHGFAWAYFSLGIASLIMGAILLVLTFACVVIPWDFLDSRGIPKGTPGISAAYAMHVLFCGLMVLWQPQGYNIITTVLVSLLIPVGILAFIYTCGEESLLDKLKTLGKKE